MYKLFFLVKIVNSVFIICSTKFTIDFFYVLKDFIIYQYFSFVLAPSLSSWCLCPPVVLKKPRANKIFFFCGSATKRARKKIFRGHVPYQGLGRNSLVKKLIFCRQTVKIFSMPWKKLFKKQFFCIVIPSLSTGSHEIFIKCFPLNGMRR